MRESCFLKYSVSIITHQTILAKFLYYMSPKSISGIYLKSAILTVSTKTLCFRSKTTWLTLTTCKSVCYVSVVAISRVQMIHSAHVITLTQRRFNIEKTSRRWSALFQRWNNVLVRKTPAGKFPVSYSFQNW